MGFVADVVVWDFHRREEMHRFKLHKVFIQSLNFSYNDRYLASLGGRDDMMLVVWDLSTAKAVCGSNVGHEPANAVKFYNNSDDKLVTVANNGFRIWNPNYQAKKLEFIDLAMGNMRRNINNVAIDDNDQFAYAGTNTGDVMEFSLERAVFKRVGPVRTLFSQGINCIQLLCNGDLIIGSGDGTIAKISTTNM
jgi:WD40 repeat protein